MKSLLIGAVLAIVGFASLAAPASAHNYRSNHYRAPSYHSHGGHGHGGHGHVHIGRSRNHGSSHWHRGGHSHGRHGGHNHGRHDGGVYFGNRDFSFGIRF